MKIKEIKLPFKVKQPILALGSQTKNTVCFAEGKVAYLSPVHPDLNNPEDFLAFERHAKHFLKRRPKVIACDLHPEYQSTKYGQSLQLRSYLSCRQAGSLELIQHHHAHVASCMAENGLLNQKVIGIAFDGTGLGTYNNIWGGEFLVSDYAGFKRAAHLKNVPLLGGEKAVLEPWRLVYAWALNKKKNPVLEKMLEACFNSPLASSAGRLFDAAGSLILGKARANFEAELAIGLEELAKRYPPSAEHYKFKIMSGEDGYIIDPLPALIEIIADLKRKEPKEKIAYKFHLTVAKMIRRACVILRKEANINKAVLSGGVFQNKLLLDLATGLLYKEKFKAFLHKEVPCNDSGISLGQAAVANFR